MTSILAGAALTLLAAAGLGRLAWRFRSPHWTLTLASGAPLLSLAVSALLVMGHATRTLVLPLCGACAAALFIRFPRFRKPGLPPWPALGFALICAPFFVLYLAHALAPEIQPDAVTYHLGLVADWARRHGFSPQTSFYNVMPLGLETLFFPAFLIGAHSAAKLVHFAFLCAIVPLFMRLGSRLGLDRTASLTAAALFAFSPVTAITGTSAYNDVALVFFSLAAFALLAEDHSEQSNAVLFHAGLAAGFCYAIKITGIVAVVGVLAWLCWQRRWLGALLSAAGAALSIVPWVSRTFLMTGNPLAPLGNRIFPNDAFHAINEEYLARYLSEYGGLHWPQIPWALGIDGTALQGLIGPSVFLLPLALFALRKPAGRAVLLAAAVLLLPWTRNIGARFFLPAFALLGLALVMALPRRAVPALLAMQAIACWPDVVDRYAGLNSWRLHGFPWRAALRLEPEDHYLGQHLYGYRFTRRLAERLQPGEPLLDLYGLPFAYLNSVPTGPLSSASFDNLAMTLALAIGGSPEPVYNVESRFLQQFARAVRVRLEEPFDGMWSIAEVTLARDGKRLPVSRNWFLDASRSSGDAWLAIDGTRATRWFTYDDARVGDYWQLNFDRPIPIDSVTVALPNNPRSSIAPVYVQSMDHRWHRISENAHIGPPARSFLRLGATRFVKQQGFNWIVSRIGTEGHGPTGESFLAFPNAWGVELADREGEVGLFRVR